LSNRAVLDGPDILRALRRISHEILEANEGPENLVILGIPTRGVELAKRIVEILEAIEPNQIIEFGILDITMYRDDLVNAEREILETSLPISGIDNKSRGVS
jgi:pyrimidine operon attenuation protein/uracil phosphoribosyltransferase